VRYLAIIISLNNTRKEWFWWGI